MSPEQAAGRAPWGAARRAVIVGGGIGGLTAALELRRAGFEVTVHERRPQLAEVDTGLVLTHASRRTTWVSLCRS